MKNKKSVIAIPVILLLIYMAWPYYSAWQLMQAVKTGNVQAMNTYVDFPRVRLSLKQQLGVAITEKSKHRDPMKASMIKAFLPIVEQMIEEAVQPETIAELIKSGKLNGRNSKKVDNSGSAYKFTVKKETISWYAFLDKPTRFKVSLDKLVMYMELDGFQWRLTTIGIDNLIDENRTQETKAEKAEFVVDEIKTQLSVIPKSVDLEQVKQDIANGFFIDSDFGDYAYIKGEFYYLPLGDIAEIKVEWLEVLDVDGEPALGQFKDEEKEQRERFKSGAQISFGTWNDKLPKKTGSGELEKVRGKASIHVPTKIEKFILTESDLNKLQTQNLSGVNLTALRNGKVSLSLYSEFSQGDIDPVVVIKNSQGQVLQTGGAFGVSEDKPIRDSRFQVPVRGENKDITVKGTPHTVEVYFPLNQTLVENEFVAQSKPKISFGKLETPIIGTRYDKPEYVADYVEMPKAKLEKNIDFAFVEKKNWQGQWHRSVQVTLPKVMNSKLAKVNFDKLRISTPDTKEWIDERQVCRERSGYVFSARFAEKGSHCNAILPIELATGVLEIRYPEKLEKVVIQQGHQNSDGVALNGSRLSFPKDRGYAQSTGFSGELFIAAYDHRGRRIAKLENSSFWNKKENEIYFWGKPDKVVLTKVTKWITLDIPKAFRPQELKRVE